MINNKIKAKIKKMKEVKEKEREIRTQLHVRTTMLARMDKHAAKREEKNEKSLVRFYLSTMT